MIQIAKTSALPMSNLLINGDFQINQRGQSEYSCTDSSYKKIYGFDMWGIIAASTTTKVTKSNNGVKFENLGMGSSVFTQRICIEKISDYVLVVKCSDVVGNLVVEIYYMDGNYENHKLSNGINIISITNKNIKDISPTIIQQGSVDIEYIDLFEGSIAYSHIKEDYATALMRCQLYYRRISVNAYGYVLSNSFNVVQQLGVIMPMIENPTITQISEGTRFNISEISYSYGATGSVYVSMKAVEAQSSLRILNGVIELSCEP